MSYITYIRYQPTPTIVVNLLPHRRSGHRTTVVQHANAGNFSVPNLLDAHPGWCRHSRLSYALYESVACPEAVFTLYCISVGTNSTDEGTVQPLSLFTPFTRIIVPMVVLQEPYRWPSLWMHRNSPRSSFPFPVRHGRQVPYSTSTIQTRVVYHRHTMTGARTILPVVIQRRDPT